MRTLLVVALALATSSAPASELRAGEAIFVGERALAARLGGDVTPLPPAATRCANCHRDARFGPVLDAASLAESRARRGGPPSRYDAASLCRLLRTGVDPADVVITRAMPRYAISDADCAALWHYLAQ